MNKIDKNKGFSLVEILAAIVILGLLSTIAIVSVNYILQKAEKEYYKSQKDEIILAAKSYTQDNRNSLPKRVGMRTEITLKTLQDKKYIGKVVDRHKRECDKDETVVQVYKYDKTHYSYTVTLVCPGYNVKKNTEDDKTGTIDIKYTGIPKDEEEIDYKKIEAKITMSDGDKIASYSYIVYRNGAEVKNSGDIEGKLKGEIILTIPLEKYLPGNIEIKVIFTDMNGNQTIASESKQITSKTDPKCDIVKGSEKDENGNPKWTNEAPVEISVKCKSRSNKGCKKDVYSQSFYESTQNATIQMEDKEGNPGGCQVDVYLDIDPPSKPVIDNQYHDIWVNKNYTIKITSVDKMSGIKQFEYRYPNSTLIAGDGKSENEWHVWENSSKKAEDKTPFESTEFKRERGEVLEVRTVDYAGNYSEVSTTIIKIDKTAPKILSVSNPYLNTWFNKANYTADAKAYVITITSQDISLDTEKNATGISGISKHYYMYPNSAKKWVEYANSGNTDASKNMQPFTFVTTPFQKDRDEKVSFNVCDQAGNCTEGESYIKLDKTPPVITITNPYANRWFNKSDYNSNKNAFKISSTATDATSGIASHDYMDVNASSWTTTTNSTINLGPYTSNMNKSVSFRAYDKAGNQAENSTNIRVDITPPSCSVSANYSPNGNNGWYKTNPTLTLNYNDTGGSQVSCYGLSSSSNVTCGATSSGTQRDTSGATWHGIVKDSAGNTATCSSNTIKVDTTPPTINLKFVPSSNTSTYVYSNSFTGTTSSSISSWQNQLLKDYVTFSDSGSGISGNLTAGYNSPGAKRPNTTISATNINRNRTSGSYSSNLDDGYRYMEYSVSDKAGNETLVKFKVNIDTEDPTCSISVNKSPDGDNGWYKTNPTIKLNKSDASEPCPSGVESYGLSTGNYTTNYTDSKTISYDTTGTGTWYGKVVDKAGNYGTCTRSSIKVDTTAPSGHITMLSKDVYDHYDFGTKTSKVPSLKITGSDSTSGIVTSGNIRFNEAGLSSCSYSDTLKYTKQYTLTSGSYTLNNPLTSDGCRYINVTLKDKAGNSKEIKALVNQRTAPVDNNPDGVCTYIDINVRTSKDVNGNAISWSNCNCGTVHTTAHYIVCKYNGKYYDKRYYYRTILGKPTSYSISPTFVCPNALYSGDVGRINAGEEITRTVGGVKHKFLTTSQSSTITWWPQYKF